VSIDDKCEGSDATERRIVSCVAGYFFLRSSMARIRELARNFL
jgi:hypothetical protein